MSCRSRCSPASAARPSCPPPSAPRSRAIARRRDAVQAQLISAAAILALEETTMQRMEIHRLPSAGPDDVSGLARLIDDGTVSARDVIAVLGKTEGNGCVNDWSRGFSTAAYAALLATRLGTTPDAVT